MAGRSCLAPLHEKALVEELAEHHEQRSHHLEADGDIEERDVAPRDQVTHLPGGDEVLQIGPGKYDAAESDHSESCRADSLGGLHRRERPQASQVDVRASEVNEE